MLLTMACPTASSAAPACAFDTIELDSLEDDPSAPHGGLEAEPEQQQQPFYAEDAEMGSLQVLSLRSNDIHVFPTSLLRLTALVSLDLADNHLLTIPYEIHLLRNLQDLVLDKNCISVLPDSLWKLPRLRLVRAVDNRLSVAPPRHTWGAMRAYVASVEEQDEEDEEDAEEAAAAEADSAGDLDGALSDEPAYPYEAKGRLLKADTSALTSLNLRANRLKGSIILGNYGNLTELDVSENSIEALDLSAVDRLRSLQCSRNRLTRLAVHGAHLSSLIAGNNKISKLSVVTAPILLRHMDVSFNELRELPDWLSGCHELRSLFASHNHLTTLPRHLFCNELPFLHTLQLAYNALQSLPSLPRKVPLQEVFLQNNDLARLPDNFFKALTTLRVLNLSNNRLCELPVAEEGSRLEKLFVTANCLSDKSMTRIGAYFRKLRVLHAAYNNFTCLPEDCHKCWPDAEELVLSGNKIMKLPDNLGALVGLCVLRVHSNLLQTCPKLSSLVSLRVLDLAHNQLDRIDLSTLIPSNLKFLDLSCNTKLHVDSQQFQTYRNQRRMSLIDVSGRNRTALPMSPAHFAETDHQKHWSVGFSETAGSRPRLYISQVRMPAFCNTEAVFALFDGESNSDAPANVDKIVPRVLLEERTVKETANEYIKYTMLSSLKELREMGQKHSISSVIVHLVRCKASTDYSFCNSAKKYAMRVAAIGDARVILVRSNGAVKTFPSTARRHCRLKALQLPLMVPDPDVAEALLDEQDEFLVMANRNLWEVIGPEAAAKEVRSQPNVILAAKRLQDLAQSYGAEDNLSVLVVRFSLANTDVDQLMKELRQTIHKNKFNSVCQAGCCCEPTTACVHCLDDDRSSPSGQSDQATCSDCTTSTKMFIHHLSSAAKNDLNRGALDQKAERRSYRGVARAVRARKEEEHRNKDETDSTLSEEQFKCWEYMLEQNSQMLFDKELNTLSKAFKRHPQLLKNSSLLSRSSPHLSDSSSALPAVPFLSRHFGSTRSFNPLPSRQAKGAAEKRQMMLGGPHAAYFGSLQRLMPYNLEYDFAVMQERGLADSMDLDRMQQYWGVTTTEL